jgi:D-arabinose 1-dehydrogenase-like Zn-dependent alcohol dehydrogenase
VSFFQLNVLLITANYKNQPWDTYFSFIKNGGTCVLLAVPEEPLHLHAGSLIMREITRMSNIAGFFSLLELCRI